MLNNPTDFDPEKDIAYNKSSRELRDLKPKSEDSIGYTCNQLIGHKTTCPYPEPVYLTSQPLPYSFIESLDGLCVQMHNILTWSPLEMLVSGVTEVSVHFPQLVAYRTYTLPEPDAFNGGGVSEVSVHFPQLVAYGTYTLPEADAFNGGGVSEVNVNFVKLVGYIAYTTPEDEMNSLGISEVSVHMG